MAPSPSRTARPPVRRALAALLFVGLVAGACGTQRSEDDIASAAGAARGAGTAPAGRDATPSGNPEPAPAGEGGHDTEGIGEPAAAPAAAAKTNPADAAGPTPPTRGRSASASPAKGSAPRAPGGATPSAPAPAGAARGTTAPPEGPGAQPAAPGPEVPTGPSAATCSEPKAPVVIGTVGAQSGVVGAALGGGTKSVQAWASAVNAAGGLDCHPVKYIVADDGSDPSRHQALVRQLVEQNGVIGLVYFNAALTGHASMAYLNDKQIPVMGQDTGSFYPGSKVHFPSISSGNELIDFGLFAAGRTMVPQGRTKAAVLTCQEASICTVSDDRWSAQAKDEGLQVVYRGQASLTQPDFTAQCLSAQSAGAQVILGVFDPASLKRLKSSCTKVGFDAPLVMLSLDGSNDMAKIAEFEGSVLAMTALPWFLTDRPAIREFRSVLDRHAPGAEANPLTTIGWTAAKLFEAAARGHLSDKPTNLDILRGLWALRDNDLGGLSYPLTFTEGEPAPAVTCGWITVIKGGRFVSDGQRVCR
jgi:branched-chain amino acid transport system substrate-binding protein